MYPVLLSFGSINIYTYGFFIALGFIAASFYILSQSKKSAVKIISNDDFYSLLLYAMVAAIAGARILYVLINIKDFLQAPLDIFKIWQGGLVYYGGFVCAVLFVAVYTKKKNIPLGKLSDIIAPALALGHAFGRIGCFFAGCCYGKECALPWAVVFTNENTLAAKGVHLHPTQLYEVFANIAVFLFLHFYNRKNQASGKTFALYLVCYAVLRFFLEFFRGDFRGAEYFGFSISQAFSVFVLAAGIIIFYKADKNAGNANLRKI